MLKPVFQLVICCMEFYIFWDFFNKVFERREHPKWRNFLTVAAAVLGMWAVNQLEIPGLNVAAFFVMDIIAAQILFKGQLTVKFIYFALYSTLAVGCEAIYSVLCITVLHAAPNFADPLIWFLATLGVKIITFILVKMWKYMLTDREYRISLKVFLGMLALPAALVILNLTDYYAYLEAGRSISPARAVGYLLLCVGSAVIYYLVEKLSVLIQATREYERFQVKSEIESRYYTRLEEINHQHLVYRHNMKHYLETIAGLAAAGQKEEILRMLDQMQEERSNVVQKNYTASGVLNALLAEKEAVAQGKGIQFQMEVEPGIDVAFIKETDLIAMFGNLLDNAIEAAEGSKEEPVVEISLFQTDGNFIMLCIKNPFREKPQQKGNRFLTTKKKKQGHGLGVESVRTVAQKYGGILYTQVEESCFTASLSLARGFVRTGG